MGKGATDHNGSAITDDSVIHEGRSPRFRCRECGRTFSRQTFATSYRLRRPELLREVASLLVSCSAHRQIARHLGCSKSTVASMARRLGEHAIDFHRSVVQPATEPVVFDHFETFVRSQVERLSLGTAVGRDSWFVYGISAAETIRRGRRSARKRAIRRKLVGAPAGALVRSTLEALAPAASPRGRLVLTSDDHPAYKPAVRILRGRGVRVVHRVHRNPDRASPGGRLDAQVRDREMFAVDLLHKLLRHSQSHHRRETIAFGRDARRVAERAALFCLWRNFIKRVSERRPTMETPAMRAGLTDCAWTWRDVLARRVFSSA